jgi:RNA polymerase sigma-70 factor, ECF subfamily
LSNPRSLHDYDPAIAELIRSKAARLFGSTKLNPQDVEDLLQECRLELNRKLGRFDPDRGDPDAFVARVLRNFLANLLRNRLARRRDPRCVKSLCRNDRDGSFRDPADDRLRPHPRLDEAELRCDVRVAINSLPPNLRDLAVRLMDRSVSQAARELGVPRTTLHSLLRKLRAVFERHDLRDYLCRPSSFRDRTG